MNLCFDYHLFINECKGLFCVAARGKRGGQRRLESSSEEDFVDGVENTTPAPRSKRQTKGRQARQKPKVSFDSDSDSEIELFDLDKSSQGQWVSNELTTSHKCGPLLDMCWWNSGWLCFYSCRCFPALPSFFYLLHRWYIFKTKIISFFVQTDFAFSEGKKLILKYLFLLVHTVCTSIFTLVLPSVVFKMLT